MGEPARTLTQTLVDLGPWVISGLALLQYWAIEVIKWRRKPKLELFRSGNLEVGYGVFGATLGLMGTLRVLHKDVFVKRICARVIREKDRSSHTFAWRAFRPNIISFNPSTPPPIQIASSFLLTTSNPLRFNLVLVDEMFLAEMAPKVGEIPRKWADFKTEKIQELTATGKAPALLAGQSTGQVIDEAIFQEFSNAGKLTNEFTLLDRSCYWNAGSYQLEFTVETAGPDMSIVQEYCFAITDEDERLLRLNSIGILRALCGLSNNPFFANPSYKE